MAITKQQAEKLRVLIEEYSDAWADAQKSKAEAEAQVADKLRDELSDYIKALEGK